MSSINLTRCAWVTEDPLYQDYHDKEWGVPVHDDRLLFEFLVLEGAQAGLNWLTVLKRREHYRRCFEQFNAERIAHYQEDACLALLSNPGIIRNRLKIQSTISNAKAFLEIKRTFPTFAYYLWRFVEGRAIQNRWQRPDQVPVSTLLSDKLSKDLKKRGFTFVGTTICYAYMQAIGMVNDHLSTCFRHREIFSRR